MRVGQFMLLITALTLAGCDRITGAANQKILDAEAIGYACRVSKKAPEDCIKENDTSSPSSILDGWKIADKDIQGQLIDPNMGRPIAPPVTPAVPATESKTAGTPAAPKKTGH